MRKLLILCLALTSVSSFALEDGAETSNFMSRLLINSSAGVKLFEKEAKDVINDIQDFQGNGRISLLLEKKINEKMAQDASLSVEDALDLIGADASSALAN